MLILTVDYEVFGNGSGCLNACVRRPVEKIINVANKYAAPVTFFVEALEYETMQQAHIDGMSSIVEQLLAAYADGHDIQLHIHPQWHGAEWNGIRWQINEKLWRLGDLDDGLTFQLLSQGKRWLESLMWSRFPEYKCIAFRAGGWCVQPSHKVVSALIHLGFEIDSTVAPNIRNITKGEWADFRNAPKKPYWKTDGDVCCEAPSGIWEIPIVTGKISRMKHFHSVKRARAFGVNGMADGCIGSYEGASSKYQSLKGKVAKLMDMGNVMLDYSTMSADVLIRISKQWIEKYSDDYPSVPLVAIAHTKNFTEESERNMTAFLSWVKKEGLEMGAYGLWLESNT